MIDWLVIEKIFHKTINTIITNQWNVSISVQLIGRMKKVCHICMCCILLISTDCWVEIGFEWCEYWISFEDFRNYFLCFVNFTLKYFYSSSSSTLLYLLCVCVNPLLFIIIVINNYLKVWQFCFFFGLNLPFFLAFICWNLSTLYLCLPLFGSKYHRI